MDYDNFRQYGQWVAAGKPGGKIQKKNATPKQLLMTVWWTVCAIIDIEEVKRLTQHCTAHKSIPFIKNLLNRDSSLVNRKGVILLHDNAKSHALVRQTKLQSVKWEVLPHPPYTPNISPCDYIICFCRYLIFYVINGSMFKRWSKLRLTFSFVRRNQNFFS